MLPRECRVERLEQALSACIDHAAAQIADHMDARIAMATSDLQAATGPELQAFERGLRRSQDAWRLAAASACEVSGRGAPVQEALCGLEAARLRKDRLETTLAELRTRMGADPLYPVPDADAVEVLIPLELPPGVGGPDSDVRVPLVIPVTPQ
ncbi:MAG: hypothetical protein AAGH68_09705 [Pseudomonadota bacterium]